MADFGGLADGARARATAPSLTTLDQIVQESLGSNHPSEAVIVETLDGKFDDDSVNGSVIGDSDTRTVQMSGTPKKKRGGGGRSKKKDEAADLNRVELVL
eukprot:jgi/Mesvir1/18315/Mv18468-RA.1